MASQCDAPFLFLDFLAGKWVWQLRVTFTVTKLKTRPKSKLSAHRVDLSKCSVVNPLLSITVHGNASMPDPYPGGTVGACDRRVAYYGFDFDAIDCVAN